MTVPNLASLPTLTPRRRRLMVFASAAIAIFIWAVVAYLAAPYDWNGVGTGHDARPYWTALFDHPYVTSRVGDHDAYLYSPAFLQLIAPLRALPWEGFMAAWEIVLMIATLLMVGPVLLGHRPARDPAGAARRQHQPAARRGDRVRVPLAGDVVVRPADQGDARPRPALVRRPARVAQPRHRAGGHGGDRRPRRS